MHFSPSQRSFILFAVAVACSALSLRAQAPAIEAVHGKKQPKHELKVPHDKQINEQINDGMLSVDGLVTKVQLNYEIHHASRLYFFAPGIGTVVLSRVNMPGSKLAKDAFNGSEINFTADGHSFNLSGEVEPELIAGQPQPKSTLKKLAKLKLPAKTLKADGYYIVDYASADLDRYPMFGYGNTMAAPYNWPLSKPAPKDTYAHFVTPPPPPANMLPRTKASPAPTPASVVAAAPVTTAAPLTTLASVN
ncbi:hypothetical protein [Granulicella paludicola]|uniref:hypothetical protein n=1 Tax=Granulicella paludicola TaxID=474951 RepID=UPI0021E054EC|nr:hypothetical protein [Granulicella paludicola]